MLITTSLASAAVRLRRPEPDLAGEQHLAHLVAPKDGKTGPERDLAARVLGLPLTALCGHVLVPSRDPRSLPDCEPCLDVFEAEFGRRTGWTP